MAARRKARKGVIGNNRFSQPSGPIIGAGTGNPTTLNIATAGTYNVVATVTDAQGCQVSIFAVLTVTNCTNCTCTPNLSLTGCVLNGGFTGAGCGNFNYQLQYSATGSGWTSVLSGSASPGGTITHTPTQNGVYRLVIVGNGGVIFLFRLINRASCLVFQISLGLRLA
jgi:hypothetical protein